MIAMLLGLGMSLAIGRVGVAVLEMCSAGEPCDAQRGERSKSGWSMKLLRWSAAWLLGIGITAGLMRICLTLGVAGRWSIFVGEVSVGAGLMAVWLRLRQGEVAVRREASGPSMTQARLEVGGELRGGAWLLRGCRLLLFAMTMTVMLTAALSMWRQHRLFPHGKFDAWAIWNLRARAIWRDPSHWTAAFDSMAQHADYPPLLPLSAARLWFLIGDETTWAPRALAMAFALSAVGCVAGAVGRWAGWERACLAVIALAAWPAWVEWSASQYADVPIGAYMTASMVWMSFVVGAQNAGLGRSTRLGGWALAGLLVGMAAATKNEGWVWVIGAAVAVWLLTRGTRRWAAVGAWCVGVALPLLAVIALQVALPRDNDLVSDRSISQIVTLVCDPARHALIVRHFWLVISAPQCWVLLLLPLLWLVAGVTQNRVRRRVALAGAIALLVTGAGYYTAYLITPHDLTWHLGTSMVRLVVQLWPGVVMAAFVSMRGWESDAV